MDFYFDASLGTFVGADIPETIIELPGSKVYTFEQDGMLYMDVFFVNGLKSGGQITMFEQQNGTWKPVWLMQYNGCEEPDKHVISTLKGALIFAYTEKFFYGGRGPWRYIEDHNGKEYFYSNHTTRFPDDNKPLFDAFGGIEEIQTDKDGRLFFHIYSGRALIDLE